MSADFDLAIIGSGFGGSLLAMIGRRIGLSVVLIERGSHPRFAIGESTSPLTNLLLEEIAGTYDLPRLKPLTAYGTWKRAYPELTVGLKRGFTFYQHRAGERLSDPTREQQLMVAASPNDEVSDTHWYRPEFDHFLVREAQELGAEYVDRTQIDSITRDAGTTLLTGSRLGRGVAYRARFLVDASGARGATYRLLGLKEERYEAYPETEAFFSHFRDVGRFGEQISRSANPPPYPPDDAALHHVFEGGWMWVLRFENGITSAGVAVEPWLARALELEGDPDAAWRHILARYPAVGTQFEAAEAILPFVYARRLSFLCRPPELPGLALLPSAMAFVDPLLSTGFPLTLLGIQRLARLLAESGGVPEEAALAEYARITQVEARTAAHLIGACYRTFTDFPSFTALTMLYFVAASYSEMARRLGRPHLASQFLLGSRPAFAAEFERCCALASRNGRLSAGDQETQARALDVFNIAGLCDPSKRNWYGVDLDDVVRGAEKLEATPEQVAAFFRAAGWLADV